LLLAGAACGGGTTKVAAPTTTAAGLTTSSRPAPTTTVPARFADKVTITTSDGGHYAFTPVVGSVAVHFAKNIDTSPPGRAKLTVNGGPADSAHFPGTIAGADGTTPAVALHFDSAVHLLWPLSEQTWTGISQQPAAMGQGCRAQSQADAGLPALLIDPALPPFSLACTFDAPAGTPWTYTGDEVDEGSVDAVVGVTIDATRAQPLIVLTARGPSGSGGPKAVEVILAPDGTYKVKDLPA
jgi:hypothetical protein